MFTFNPLRLMDMDEQTIACSKSATSISSFVTEDPAGRYRPSAKSIRGWVKTYRSV